MPSDVRDFLDLFDIVNDKERLLTEMAGWENQPDCYFEEMPYVISLFNTIAYVGNC